MRALFSESILLDVCLLSGSVRVVGMSKSYDIKQHSSSEYRNINLIPLEEAKAARNDLRPLRDSEYEKGIFTDVVAEVEESFGVSQINRYSLCG